MKEYLVLYRDSQSDRNKLARLVSADPRSTKPEDWGLTAADKVILVLVGANFLNAYVEGEGVNFF